VCSTGAGAAAEELKTERLIEITSRLSIGEQGAGVQANGDDVSFI
jgi:hypothetical protein